MKVFGFRIETRFWVILGVLALFIVGALYIKSQAPEEHNPFVEPAFGLDELPKLKPDWMDPYISAYDIQDPEVFEELTALSVNQGMPFRLRVYVPSSDEAADRPDLVLSQYGWEFLPAVFISPTEVLNAEQLPEKSGELTDGQPLMLGFPDGQRPADGGAYEITGLLYWHSHGIKPAEDDEGGLASPVILVSSARALSNIELGAPATHKADLNISYAQKNQQITIKSVEWAAGKQVRACVSIVNTGSKIPLSLWDGTTSFRAAYPESSDGSPDPESSLSTQTEMDLNTPITGYILFDRPPSGAPENMKLFVPSLSDAMNFAPTEIGVKKNQFKQISKDQTRGAATGCSA